MVLALNMMDEVRGNGGTIDVAAMSEELGIAVVPISAAKNEGIDELIRVAVQTVKEHRVPKRVDFCDEGPVHRCIHAVSHLIEDHAQAAGIARRFAATKLIEGDEDIIRRLELNQNEREMLEHSIVEMEDEGKLDRNAAIASMRYDYIERLCAKTVVKCQESKGAPAQRAHRPRPDAQIFGHSHFHRRDAADLLADLRRGRRGASGPAGAGHRQAE